MGRRGLAKDRFVGRDGYVYTFCGDWNSFFGVVPDVLAQEEARHHGDRIPTLWM